MKTTRPIRIILADDHEIFRDGFKAMLRKQPSVQLVAEAGDGASLLKLVVEHKPDVVVTDIKMPIMDGLQVTRELGRISPATGVIALSMFDEENLIVDMLEAGARGYLLKNAHKDEIIEAIKTVYEGSNYYCNHTSAKLASMIAQSPFGGPRQAKKIQFSEREFSVIRYICQEMSNKQIAGELHLSIRTIEGYRDRIQEKIGAKNAAGIVVYAIRNNIYKVN
jgi:DNA-binding NarL/FixJ family response regulator